MSRPAPWWLTWLLTAGIAVFLIGERVLATSETARAILMALSGLLVLGVVAWRARSWAAAEGEAKRVERILSIAYVGCALALVVHVACTAHGIRWLGIEFDDDAGRTRYLRTLQVAWTILLFVSLLPALAAQISIGASRHTRGLASGIESLRVTENAGAGLSVACACAALFLICFIATERNHQLDMSYFKTSAPGGATVNIASSLSEPLRVDLFFRPQSEVGEEVRRYFENLGSRAEGKIRIEQHDRLSDPKLSTELDVAADGTIVLRKGAGTERILVGDSMAASRGALRKLDRDVQTVLFLLLRARRTAYLTRGHGEINDTISAASRANRELRGIGILKRILAGVNYDLKDLSLQQGLGSKIPDDAAVVAVLGPQTPFLPEELATLDAYLAGGGKLLLGLDPTSGFELGPLEKRLGIAFHKVELADEDQHLRQRGAPSDRRLIVTDRFSFNDRIAPTLSGVMGNGALIFAGAGYMDMGADTSLSHVSFLVRSLGTTFDDQDGDYTFDEGKERKGEKYLVAAIEAKAEPGGALDSANAEKPSPAPPGSVIDTLGWRAFVVADAEAFSDPVLGYLGLNAAMVNDGLKWLGNEEALAGSTESELDVPIQHTQSADVIWFYSIILGAPLLVLGVGLGSVFRRQRRRAEASA